MCVEGGGSWLSFFVLSLSLGSSKKNLFSLKCKGSALFGEKRRTSEEEKNSTSFFKIHSSSLSSPFHFFPTPRRTAR